MRLGKRSRPNVRHFGSVRASGARFCAALAACALGVSVLMAAGPVLAGSDAGRQTIACAECHCGICQGV